ncbi:MAG: RecB-family nuclease [Candidatus Baldrarchaeia archaeon]
MEERLVVVFHGVSSVQRVKDMARLIAGLGFSGFVVTKVEGSAAVTGVPEAFKIIYKEKKRLVCLPDLKDAIELFEPSTIYLFVPPRYAEKEFDEEEVIKKLSEGKKVMLIFGGMEPSFTRAELSLGTPVRLDVEGDVGPIATAALALYRLRRRLRGEQ